MSGKEVSRVSEKGNRVMSKIKPWSTSTNSPDQEHKHVPNYMKPTISSSLGQYRRSLSSSSFHAMVAEDTLTTRRGSLDKSTPSPCPRISRNLSLTRESSRPLMPSSPRKLRNQLYEPSKSHLSKGHSRGSSLDMKSHGNEKKFLSSSITSSRVASPDGDAMKRATRIEDRGDNHLESLAPSFCHDPPPAVESNERVMVVRNNHHDDEIFDEVQAMVLLEDYNRENEISPAIFEDNKEHVVVVDKGNHDDVNESSNEIIHPPHDDNEISNEINHAHDDEDVKNSNEIHPKVVDDDDKEHIPIVLSYDDNEKQDEYCQVDQNSDENPPSMVEDVDKEEFVIVQADNHDQVGMDNSREILEVMAGEEDEKDVIIVHEEVHDHQTLTHKKQEDVEEGDHSEPCSTNLDINEETKVSNFDESNTKDQDQDHDQLNVIEVQEQAITSTNVLNEKAKEQVNESIIVTQVNEEQGETNKVKEEASTNKRMIINKKETTMAYNDVIEETKSKLLQDRKNKVLALVGAFETVMSIDKGKK